MIPFESNAEIKKVLKHLQQHGWAYPGIGSDLQPHTVLWHKKLVEAIGSQFKDGISVIDWGCGYGRFLNHMILQKINGFTYYGFDVPSIHNGDVLIPCNKEMYSKYSNAFFGFINDKDLVEQAWDVCDIVILGSVFTHITVEAAQAFIHKCDSILHKENGMIVFSLIMRDKYHVAGPYYNYEGAFGEVHYTNTEIELLKADNKHQIKKINKFVTDGSIEHTIFKLTLRK